MPARRLPVTVPLPNVFILNKNEINDEIYGLPEEMTSRYW